MSSQAWLALLFVLSPILATSHAATQTDSSQVLGRSKVEDYGVGLNEADWSWLWQKGTLRLGVSVSDYPPFDITSDGRHYEGLTADYAGLIAELLHVQVTVRRFDSRAEAVRAMKNDELDLLAPPHFIEETDSNLVMSDFYAEDRPTLVTRNDDRTPLTSNLAGKKVAMLYHYLPLKSVRELYPEADLQLYPSTLSAIGAVAVGKADVYLGDAISTHFMISRNYFSNLKVVGFPRLQGSHFAFAMTRENTHLLRIINATLAQIPVIERRIILRRWGMRKMSIPDKHPLQLSAREQRWLEQHPRVKVAVIESFLPMSFFDEQGEFRGISADVLALISLRTGLKFNVLRGDSMVQQIDQLHDGKVDVLAVITPSGEREGAMRFTRPYLTTPFALVSRVEANSPTTLDEMAGKRLVLIRGMVPREFFTNNFPRIRILCVDNATQAMDMLARGEVDGAINSLLSARHMISRHYHERLQVASTVGEEPARVSFSTDRGALELSSILDKALLSICPEEMSALANRWHSDVVIDDSYWLRNRRLIIQGFCIVGGLLLLAFVWITYLRRLIRRREEAEQALNNQMEFMRVLIDGTPHPIYVRDREGRMKICNAGYLDAFGLKREATLGKRITESEFTDPVEALVYHDEYLKVMEEGTPLIQDRSLTTADGKVLTVHHWILPYRDTGGVVIGMIAGWIDVSERQRLLGLVQESKDMADDASRAKTTFLATMSHEIRTPVNAVIGMLELALKKAEQGVLDRFAIEVAAGAAQDLLDLIGDILDIARIESGKLSLSPERANLRELLESLMCIFEGLASQKHLQLILDLDSGANCDVLIDQLRFKQIVSNLLSNAIKFTAEGEIRLTLEVLPTTVHERLPVRLLIEDSGAGISAEDQQRLFSPFSRASNNTQSARTGSGLGLVISRTLCEMMGGVLSLSSELGKGTQVEVLLDLQILEPLMAAKIPAGEVARAKQALRILVVDDYPANRLLLSKQLGYLGHRVIEAEEGAHGLRAWINNNVDVVITDCNMPIMNGYALTRAIRDEEQARGRSRCLIMGFTANALSDEKARCLEAGMDDCLFKPISLKALGERLALASSVTAQFPTGQEIPAQVGTIDFTYLEQLVLGDSVAMNELLDELAMSNHDDLARLPTILFEQDLQGLLDLAHKVKGGARMVKARRLIAACEQLEAVCEAKDDESVLEQVVGVLKQEMSVLAMSLKTYAEKTGGSESQM
ncbi:hybrid sensor histidine kinase/response regulator [Pseudomonas brassicacearum]|uniref:histidine kinase n=1 Tax=Pseudomonas brassicacearum TaxID=930166 RepID=A0A423GNI4_9PSED|nr:hybrid sensor histidine kinase/response regulator [Pseudomonas brassicacearum]